MTTETPLDRFKAVLGGTARAIAHEPEVELAFTADSPAQSGKHIKVPMPARTLPAEQVAEARGFADGFALRLRHHDTKVHARLAPGDAVARSIGVSLAQFLPLMFMPPSAFVIGAVLAVGLGVLSCALPCVQVWRLEIVEQLRRA